LTKYVSCSTRLPHKLVNRKGGAHVVLYTTNPRRKISYFSILCKEGYSKTETARIINRHISTISRELKCNTGKKGYRPKQAHERALKMRHTSRKAIKFTDGVRQFIDDKIRKQFSPDQISGKLRKSGIENIPVSS
jgi:IS30 family transposase